MPVDESPQVYLRCICTARLATLSARETVGLAPAVRQSGTLELSDIELTDGMDGS